MGRMLKIKQVKSLNGRPKKQREVLRGMGLHGKINKEVCLQDTAAIRGMVRKVSHLVIVEECERSES